MTIMVECKCGRKVEIDFSKTFINMPHSGYDILIGEQKCPNPDCDRTIFINANITVAHTGEENWINSKVNWKEAKIGDIIYVDRCPYEIALKSIRRAIAEEYAGFRTHLIYLRSKSGDYNVIGEVKKDGSIFLHYGKDSTTPAGYETWSEEDILKILNKLNVR